MRREKFIVGSAILGLALISWLVTIWNIGPAMGMPTLPLGGTAIALFVATWTVGMTAMMFPTAMPMLLTFFSAGRGASPEIRQGGGPSPSKAFVFTVSYLAVWVATGLLIYVALAFVMGVLPMEAAAFVASPAGLGLALILVAAYQFSPVKGECLNRCHPTSFLFRYFKGGSFGPVRMGLQYAKYCVGCCWVMMVFLLLSASMGVVWMAVFAGIIFAERSLTSSAWAPKVVGLGFLVSGILFIAVG